MQKILLFTIISFLLLMPSTNATCLTTEQVSAITILLQNSNITGSDKTAFLSIFDVLCNQSYSRSEFDSKMSNITNFVNSKTDNINDTVQQEINNYTNWFEEREDISESISAMAEIVNASLSIRNIEDMLESKNQEYIDIVDDMYMKWADEKKSLVTKEEFEKSMNDLDFNLTTLYYQNFQQQSNSPINWNYVLIAVVVLAIIGYVVYGKTKFTKYKTKELKKLPPARHRKMTDEQTEEVMHKIIEDAIRKKQKEQVDEEAKIVEQDLEQENNETKLKDRLKRKGT